MEPDPEFDAFARQWSRKLRFAIEGSTGKFSTAWAVWGHGNTLYLAGRISGGFIKVSLHPEGGYRFAFTKDFHQKLRAERSAPESRTLAVWPRPDIKHGDRELVASLFFPTDYLASGPPPSSLSKRYLLLEAARPNWTVQIGFFLSRSGAEEDEKHYLTFGRPLFRWGFDDGSSISMVYWERPFDRASIPSSRKAARVVALTDAAKLTASTGPRLTGLLWNDAGPGVPLQIIEVGGVAIEGGLPAIS